MRITKHRPVDVGEMLTEEFLGPWEATPAALAKAMDVPVNTVDDLLNGGTLSAPLAIKLSVACGNSPEFWLNLQHAVNLWDARNRYADEAISANPLWPGVGTERCD